VPIEPTELIKLIGGIFIIIIPGYLWSFLFFKQLTILERVVFGFVISLIVLTCGVFAIEIIFNFSITQNILLLLYIAYTIPVVILFSLSVKRFGKPKIPKKEDIINKKNLLLVFILSFVFFVVFIPHLKNGYFLPFHVDEWIHWSYTREIIESASSSFVNPYTGIGITQSQEVGFHLMTTNIHFLSNSSLITMFLFLPSIIMVFTSLTVFNLGQRAKCQFGLEGAFLVAFIPTTCRFLGPSFYVPVGVGLLFLVFILWLGQLKKIQAIILLPLLIFFLFIMHPPTALAGLILVMVYSLWLLFEKKYLLAILSGGFSVIPVIAILILATRWKYGLNDVINAVFGTSYDLWLPKIWTSFEYLGLITWIFFVIGVYFCFSKGKTIQRTIGFSSMIIIISIGIYDKLGYGVPIFYERAFMYLYLLVALAAAIGISEFRNTLPEVIDRYKDIKIKNFSKYIRWGIPIVVAIILLLTAFPAHLDIQYYQMINEEEYENFTWIHDNIDKYRNETYKFDKAAVAPFKASPFSAITGLYILSSSMHPLYGYNLHQKMSEFLNNGCINSSFMDKYEISVVYTTSCNNENLTAIYPNVYLYTGLYE